MNDHNEQTQSTDQHQPIGTQSVFAKPLVVGLAVLVVCLAAFVAYAWQNSTSSASSAELESVNKELKAIKQELASLKAKDGSSADGQKATTGAVSQSDLKVTVNSAGRFNAINNVNRAGVGVFVRVTVSNPTSSPIALDTASLKLKDKNDQVYQAKDQAFATSAGNAPSGVLLSSQTVAANETVSGNLYFEVENTSLMDFQLVNATQTYQVKVTN